jgi:phosphotransacetylase
MLSSKSIECPAYLLRKAEGIPSVPTAIVNAGSPLPLESAKLGAEQGLIDPVLVGDPVKIQRLAAEMDWDIASLRLIPAYDEVEAADVSVSLARNGEVASLMKGDVHTDILLRAAIQKETGLRTKTRFSHVFHMTLPGSDQVLYITDAAINVLPTVGIKLDILRNSVSLLHAMGNAQPKVALLSATEVPNKAVASSIDAEAIVNEVANGAVENVIVGGPLAFDNAVSKEAAAIKSIDNPVAGCADVLLVPNIETGNALYKQMVYFMGASAAGVVMGAKVPIVLTSRADPVAARLASIALASIYASA